MRPAWLQYQSTSTSYVYVSSRAHHGRTSCIIVFNYYVLCYYNIVVERHVSCASVPRHRNLGSRRLGTEAHPHLRSNPQGGPRRI